MKTFDLFPSPYFAFIQLPSLIFILLKQLSLEITNYFKNERRYEKFKSSKYFNILKKWTQEESFLFTYFLKIYFFHEILLDFIKKLIRNISK